MTPASSSHFAADQMIPKLPSLRATETTLNSCSLVVELSKIIFFIKKTIPQQEDIILLYIRYHGIPKYNTN